MAASSTRLRKPSSALPIAPSARATISARRMSMSSSLNYHTALIHPVSSLRFASLTSVIILYLTNTCSLLSRTAWSTNRSLYLFVLSFFNLAHCATPFYCAAPSLARPKLAALLPPTPSTSRKSSVPHIRRNSLCPAVHSVHLHSYPLRVCAPITIRAHPSSSASPSSLPTTQATIKTRG